MPRQSWAIRSLISFPVELVTTYFLPHTLSSP